MRNRPSAHVCSVCRNRKVKCDGRAGGCENCARLNYQCSFGLPDGQADIFAGPDGANNLARRRARLACQPCKAQKARCSGEQPTCLRCRQKHVECVYLPSKRTKVAQAPASATESPSSTASREPIRATVPIPRAPALPTASTASNVPAAATAAAAAPPPPRPPPPSSSLPLLPPLPAAAAASADVDMESVFTIPIQPDVFGPSLSAPATAPSLASDATYDSMKADRTTIKKCIDAFFNVLYPSPEYSFIHKAVFLQMWQAGDIDTVLLKAVCGVAARFVPGQTQAGRDQGSAWIDEAQADLLSSFDRPAVVRLQALQLVVLHCQAMRQFRRLLFLFALCTRMAFLLRLNYEDPALPFLAQESRRRLMWSIFVTDTILGGGTPDFVLCPARKVHIRLPAEEPSFQLDRAVNTEPLRPDPNNPPSHTIGLLAYFIRVMDIRDRVLRFTKDISNENIDPSSMANHFQAFESELSRLRDSLPANMAFSAKNLSLRAYSKNSLPRFVLLHVWWHQCHCDLFRFLIPGFRESVSGQMMRRIPAELSQYCRSQCVAHARSLADIFHLLNALDQDVPITDAGLAVPAYQCANILSRSRKMPGMPGGFDITAGVQACLEFTRQLSQYNTMAAVISEDIQKLLEYGAPSAAQSRHRTPERDGSSGIPTSPNVGEMPKYKFSRHNAVDAANVRDDGADLGYRNAVTPFSPMLEDQSRVPSRGWTGAGAAQDRPSTPSALQATQVAHSHVVASTQTSRPHSTPQLQQLSMHQQQQQPPPTILPSQAARGTPQPAQQAILHSQAYETTSAIPLPVDPLQQQILALQQQQQQQQQAQQAYVAQTPHAVMSLNETNDWTWDMPLPGNEQTGLDSIFDPLWRIHNQWDVRG